MARSPLWAARLVSLSLAWALAGASFALVINALVRSNRDKSSVTSRIPAASINTNDVTRSGGVVAAFSLLIFFITTMGLVSLCLRRVSSPRRSMLTLQAALLALSAVGLTATLIPFTLFFATRNATASVNGNPIPQSAVSALERQLGVISQYRRIWYLRLVAIVPWITALFTIIAAVILLATAIRVRRSTSSEPLVAKSAPADDAHHDPPTTEEQEKPVTEHVERPAAA